jgi:hypothetical protein
MLSIGILNSEVVKMSGPKITKLMQIKTYLDALRYFALALSRKVALGARAQKKMVRLLSRSDPKNNVLICAQDFFFKNS